MKDRESEEMYLETILIMKKAGKQVRSVDVVAELGYAKSSVSRAVNLLEERGYIVIGQGGELNFTPSGQSKAVNIYDRHRVLTKALMGMGVPRETAEENACRIEHVITEEVFEIIKRYVEKDAEEE